jgi:peroxiredoxin
VNQLSGKPFALLGVHSYDLPPKKLKEVMDKEKLNWRSLSSRAVTVKWSARGTPAYYILDHKGVIRYKWTGYPGAKAIDDALEKLIKEAEENAKP